MRRISCLKITGGIRVFGYETKGYSAIINSLSEYYRASMALLHRKVRKELFYRNGRNGGIYTKLKDPIPAKYGPEADVSNSLIADGSLIEGRVENCIIFRGVRIAKGASVKNSVIMQSSKIEAGAHLDYVITDKNVRVTRGRVLTGAQNCPMVIKKDKVV